MEHLIKIQNLTLGYDKEPVLQNVDLEIFENDFIGVIGPNGGGKTTLLKAVLGLLKPMSGKIIFRKDINGQKKPIGYLPQVKHIDRNFPITVFDVVRSGSLMKNTKSVSETDIRKKTEELLVEMGIANIRNKAIGELSGGQMQRVFLCRALLSNPKILILDEPTTGLHFDDVRKLLNVLDRLVEHGNTVLVIEHNLEVIKSADHIIDLGPGGGNEGGQILFEGTPEGIIQNPMSFTGKYLKKIM